MKACCKMEEHWVYVAGRRLLCRVCGGYISLEDAHKISPDYGAQVTEPGDLTLTLPRTSWENLFLVLGEKGLGPTNEARVRMLLDRGVEDAGSDGNFWAAIQSLQSQFESQTGEHPRTHY